MPRTRAGGGGVSSVDGQTGAVALTATYEPKNRLTVDTLLARGTAHFAHRGSAGLHLENSVEGMELLTDMGYPAIDGGDLWLSRDGSDLLAFHNTTVGSDISGPGALTTPSSTVPGAFSVGGWRQVKLLSSVALATGLPFDNIPDAKPATLSDYCRLAKRAGLVIAPEMKSTGTATVTKAIEIIQRYGVEKQVILCSFTAADLAAPKAAGIKTAWIQTSLPAGALATLQANNVDFFHYNYTNGTFDVASLQAISDAGISLAPWTFQRRSQITVEAARVSRPLAWVMSDHAMWTSGLYTPATADPFASGTPFRGQIPSGANRGRFTRQGKLSIINSAAVWQGWASKDTASTNQSWQQKVTYETIGASSNLGAYILFGLPDDQVATNGAVPQGGYYLNIRPSGVVNLYRILAGATTQIGSTLTIAAGAYTAGGLHTWKCEFIGTTVKVTCVETTQTISGTDSTYRGGGLAYGNQASDCEVSFSSVAVA